MRRLAGCLVVSLLASAAAWVGCRDDLGDETLPLLAGSGTDAGVGGDAYGGGSGVPDAIVVVDDVGIGEGSGSDAAVQDAGIGEGSGSDAAVQDAGIGEGSGSDAGSASDAGVGGDAYGGGGSNDGGSDDGGGDTDAGGGRPDARRGPEIDPTDRTSFYACAGGPASAGIEVGLPIALALAIAVRRRRRWRQAGSPDRAP
jgi:hypothetical protein